jgi:hypothetical protein
VNATPTFRSSSCRASTANASAWLGAPRLACGVGASATEMTLVRDSCRGAYGQPRQRHICSINARPRLNSFQEGSSNGSRCTGSKDAEQGKNSTRSQPSDANMPACLGTRTYTWARRCCQVTMFKVSDCCIKRLVLMQTALPHHGCLHFWSADSAKARSEHCLLPWRTTPHVRQHIVHHLRQSRNQQQQQHTQRGLNKQRCMHALHMSSTVPHHSLVWQVMGPTHSRCTTASGTAA